jgi:hypothetical protein
MEGGVAGEEEEQRNVDFAFNLNRWVISLPRVANQLEQRSESEVMYMYGRCCIHGRSTIHHLSLRKQLSTLDPFLILRTSKLLVDQDPSLVGNLLVERLVGARLQLISKEEYSQIGSVVSLLLTSISFISTN